jgi:AcrR family transcriptional regulator
MMEPPNAGKPVKLSLVWAQPEKPTRAQQPSLSREQIVRAAIELADAEGDEALSMRRIAAQLGVGTMSLYWYIASKQDLFDLVYDAVLGELDLAKRPSGDWRADLRHFAGEMRALLLRHSWLGVLLDSRPPLGPNGLRFTEQCLAAIDGLGLDGPTMIMVLETLVSYVNGFALSTMAEEKASRRSGVTEKEWQAALIPYMQQVIATGQYPTIAHQFMSGKGPPDTEASFEFGLTCILDGIASHIAERHP